MVSVAPTPIAFRPSTSRCRLTDPSMTANLATRLVTSIELSGTATVVPPIDSDSGWLTLKSSRTDTVSPPWLTATRSMRTFAPITIPFDAEIDAREKAGRPISCGEVARSTVFAGGAAFLCAGLLIAALLGAWLAGLALAAAILLYDWQHKRTALSPMIMGAARLCCYLLAASAAGGINGTVWVGALGLMAHTAGLTYAARQEAYDRIGSAWPLAMLAVPVLHALVATGGAALAVAIWAGLLAALGVALARLFRRAKGDVPKAVVTMIAAMSLYDAVLIAGAGQGALALIAVAGFGLTLLLQRVVSGT